MNKKGSVSGSRVALGLLLIGLFVTFAVAWNEKIRAEEVAEQEFTAGCEEIQSKIEVHLSSHEQILRSGAAFFADDNGVSRAEWRMFAETQKINQTLPGIQAGTLMYLPVYRLGSLYNTLAERRAVMVGWVYSPYRMNDLMQGILGHLDLMELGRIHLKIFDGGTASPETLLYDSQRSDNKQPALAPRLTQQAWIEAAGRRWLLSFASGAGRVSTVHYGTVWLWLIGGTAVSLLLSGLVFVLVTTRCRARRMAQRLTAELRESETLCQFALEGAGDGVWDWDVPSSTVYFSKQWKQMLGYAEDEIGTDLNEWSSRVHPEDLSRVMADLQLHLDGQTATYSNEYRLRCKDGHYKWILSRGLVITRDAAGKPLRTVGMHTDTTERKKTEEALARTAREWQLTFNASNDGIWLLDEAHRIVRSNRQANRLFPSSAGGKGIQCWEVVHGTTGPIADCPVVRAKESLQRETMELQIGDRWFLVIADPILDASGHYAGAVHIFCDITEQRETESQLRQAQKMEAIGQLAGGVAHDFNNSLQAILGYTDLAFTYTNPSEKIHVELTKIQQAANHSAELTRQLLTFARKQIITPKTLNLNTALESMLTMLRRLIRENIRLVWMPKDNLWSVKIDPSQLAQILTNLSINARDAIDGTGEIRIQTANVTLDQVPSAETCLPGEYVQLSFSDDGCGMDEETLKHLFEPFFTTKEVGQGTGLGSATSYGIVQQNHGFITVDSAPGKGTTFQIYLPRSADPEVEAEEKTPIPPSEEDGHETILLVEDEALLLEFGQQMLEALGYTVLAANLPDKALCLAKEYRGKIDLLLTDVIMPGMNGQELATHLQALRPSLKCLFMSGYSAEMIASDNVLPEGVHFIPKPFSTRELSAKIRAVLAGRPVMKDQTDD